MIKKTVKMILFLTILMIVLGKINQILSLKYVDGILSFEVFYRQERDSVDVLVLGSSHAYMSVNTGILWEEFGYPAYDLGSGGQLFINTYYFFKEAIKTQRPKAVILETYLAASPGETMDDARRIKSTFGMKPSLNKIEVIMESTPKERWMEFFIEFPQYHTRYREVMEDDFNIVAKTKNYKGFETFFERKRFDTPDIMEVTEINKMEAESEKYYRKILELAIAEDIPILVIEAPYCLSEDEQKYFNHAAQIAGEYQIPFINFNLLYQEMGLDFTSDFSDASHLNYYGSIKLTKYLGNYLTENFELKDQRGNEKYRSWDSHVKELFQRNSNLELQSETQIKNYFDKLKNDDYTVVFSLTGGYADDSGSLKDIMTDFGVKEEEFESGGVWIKEDGRFLYYNPAVTDYYYHQELGAGDLILQGAKDGDGQMQHHILMDHTEYFQVPDGVNVYVFDNVLGITADDAAFDSKNGFVKSE